MFPSLVLSLLPLPFPFSPCPLTPRYLSLRQVEAPARRAKLQARMDDVDGLLRELTEREAVLVRVSAVCAAVLLEAARVSSSNRGRHVRQTHC